ncbi:MAG: hypothetical protein DDT28_00055 [Dehalococcoidia bacterium]|nr:hypothetical protein [Chloroflexota bacterium]
MNDRASSKTRHDSFGKRGQDSLFGRLAEPESIFSPAILLLDDHLLGYIDEPSSKIATIRGAQSRVGQALAGTMGRNEILQDGKSLAEVGFYREFDDPS